MSKEYIGEGRLLATGFKRAGNRRFIQTRQRKVWLNRFRSVMTEEIIAEIVLDEEGYAISCKGIRADTNGLLLIYRGF